MHPTTRSVASAAASTSARRAYVRGVVLSAPAVARAEHHVLAELARRDPALLDGYRGPVGAYEHLTLVASHLGEGPRGRPRHEVLAKLPLGG